MAVLRPTDIPEDVIAKYAEMLGIDAIDVIDRLVFDGDHVLLPLGTEWAWVWSPGDEEDEEMEG